MTVKIFITRRIPKDREPRLLPLLIQLRALAISQPGYIAGETLRNLRDPEEYVVVSTWRAMDHWESWSSSPQRREIQEKIDALLPEETRHRRYLYG